MAALLFSGCTIPRDTGRLETALRDAVLEPLEAASREAGQAIRTERASYLVVESNIVGVAAPMAGLEQVPATRLSEGVDIALAHFQEPSGRIAAGSYVLRAFADVAETGDSEGRVEFREVGSGEVVMELPATLDVSSMTVPERPGFNETLVNVGTDGSLERAVFVWIVCPNGWIICIRWPILVASPF